MQQSARIFVCGDYYLFVPYDENLRDRVKSHGVMLTPQAATGPFYNDMLRIRYSIGVYSSRRHVAPLNNWYM